MRVIRAFVRLVVSLLALAAIAMVVAAYLAFDTHPAIDRAAEVTPDNIALAKRILEANDPRFQRPGAVRTIAVAADEVDVAVNYLMRRYAGGSGQVAFDAGIAHVSASVHPPALPASVFLNLRASFRDGSPFPRVTRVRAGSLPVPVWVAEAMLRQLFARAFTGQDLELFDTVIRQVVFSARGASMTYEWQPGLEDTMRNALVTPDNEARLRRYHQRLVEVTGARAGGSISLADLMSPLFALAADESRTSDPVAENRAAILVLTAYVNRQSLAAVVPGASSWPQARRLGVTLNQRDDFAKHFIVSAALAANTGGPFADAVGLYKEIADSRGGSGFSFNDIAADRAGSRFGELAERPGAARQLQERVRPPLAERAIMPETSDLPEFMPEPEFQRRYGGVGAPPYNRMMADIERRVLALPALR